MSMAFTNTRYCAISMQLAAYLDGHYVEMHILMDTGKFISIVCDRDSIFSIQRQIEKFGRNCPEVATWAASRNMQAAGGDVHGHNPPAPSGKS